MIRFFSTPLSLGNNILRTQCNIVVAKQHIICRKATSFIEDNIILCPLERNDDDRRRSNSVLATLAIVLCPYGHKHKKEKQSNIDAAISFIIIAVYLYKFLLWFVSCMF